MYDRLKEIPDPRSSRNKKHECAEMLAYVILGYLSGRTALRRAVSWAKANEAMLRKHMKLKGGIASVPTLSRLLNDIDEEIFALTFTDWVTQLLKGHGLHIIIDGKALRGSAKKIQNGNVPYLLNAIEATTEMVLTQFPIDTKTNEITAIPQLLDWIDIEGNTVTIDAIGTQTAIMEKINSGNAWFVLQVKKNQPNMYEDIISYFKELEDEKEKKKKNPSYHSAWEEQLTACDSYVSSEKNRERYEHREYMSSSDVACLSEYTDMTFIKTIGMSRQIRRMIIRDKEGNDITPDMKSFVKNGSTEGTTATKGDGMTDAIQEVGIISNRELDAETMGIFKRNHWKIENALHHVLDDVFREDRSPAKGSKNNLALIRKFAYNIIRYAHVTLPDTTGVLGMMDWFSDNPEKAAKYIFSPLECLSCPRR